MCAVLHFFVNLNIFNKPASMCSILCQIFSIFSIQSTVTSNFRASCIISVVAVSSNHVLWILFIFRNAKLLMNLNMVWWHYTQAEIEHSTIFVHFGGWHQQPTFSAFSPLAHVPDISDKTLNPNCHKCDVSKKGSDV